MNEDHYPQYFEVMQGNVRIQAYIRTDIGEDFSPDPISTVGFCRYDFPDQLMKQFAEDSDGGEICAELFGKEELEPNENTNPDVFLSFVLWHNDTFPEGEIIRVDVTCQHPFCIFHDLCHIEGRDVISCEGQVTSSLERDRLIEGFKAMEKHGDYSVSSEYGHLMNESFFRRFKEPLNLWRYFKEPEYEKDED